MSPSRNPKAMPPTPSVTSEQDAFVIRICEILGFDADYADPSAVHRAIEDRLEELEQGFSNLEQGVYAVLGFDRGLSKDHALAALKAKVEEAERSAKPAVPGGRERLPDERPSLTKKLTLPRTAAAVEDTLLDKIAYLAERVADEVAEEAGRQAGEQLGREARGAGELPLKLLRDLLGVEKTPPEPMKIYVTAGFNDRGEPREVFIRAEKAGSFMSGILDGFALMMSMALQHGAPREVICDKLENTKFEPSGYTGDDAFPRVKSPLDYLAR